MIVSARVIFLLVLGSASVFAYEDVEDAEDSALTRVIAKSKNGIFEINTKNNQVVLNSTKNDGSQMRIEFYVEEPRLQGKPLGLQQCALYTTCVTSGNITHTVIKVVPNQDFVTINRFLPSSKGRLTDCLSLRDDTQWIGGPQYRYQHWPVQHMYFEEEPYIPTHPENMGIAERYWLSSRGFSLRVMNWVPLFLDQNNIKDKYLCLIAENKAPYSDNSTLAMSYEISWHNNSRLAHQSVVNRHLGKPSGYPDVRMIRHPIWSTWARYKVNVSEKVVNDFADEIVKNKFNNSQLEIDDNWETCYGSAVFDPVKFPNVTRMTQSLKRKGFRVTLWIHPFINKNCNPAYSEALKNGYFVKSKDGQVLMDWWQSTNNGASTIDFTNPKAVAWWVGRLKQIQKLGIDSFKFDAGESSWLPQVANLTGPIQFQPGIFTKSYINALASNFDRVIEARVGWATQDLPIFIRMIDKDSRWTWKNGLPTLITTLVQMNMAGYGLVLPDMIGGNGYLNGMLNGTVLPSKELFIRWLQCNVFMPSLQYSFVPWDFDQQTINISRKYTDLHAAITPSIVKAMEAAVKTGAPVNPPIWWVDPDNQEAHKINDEYLLGEEVLVAPVITENAIVRDIYLPKGNWKDGNNNRTYKGPMWLRDYPAPIDILPYFTKSL
ncbi:myogenesis-regulating glycosidase [Microplitis mediator]|uniref:myogenesis-regulating glycosidase n=1 Tax=Microplitis mediator TaxID=375433 RepID=UPI002555419B|nr:myogenesis-regulating glycosidase [Microplitis mediator]